MSKYFRVRFHDLLTRFQSSRRNFPMIEETLKFHPYTFRFRFQTKARVMLCIFWLHPDTIGSKRFNLTPFNLRLHPEPKLKQWEPFHLEQSLLYLSSAGNDREIRVATGPRSIILYIYIPDGASYLTFYSTVYWSPHIYAGGSGDVTATELIFTEPGLLSQSQVMWI